MPGSAASQLPYHPDIDGLRAVAALSVIGCHAEVIPGGLAELRPELSLDTGPRRVPDIGRLVAHRALRW